MPTTVCRRALLAAVVTLASACGGDVAAPLPGLAVSLGIVGSPSESLSESAGGVRITCDVALSAAARGFGGAAWQDGMLRFYLGQNRAVAADSQRIDAAEVRGTWGSRIAAGEVQHGGWNFVATAPFEVEVEFRYQGENGASVAPARVRFPCGPVPSASAAAPIITALTVSPGGEVHPGDDVDVTYTASAPYALWTTTVAVSGPFISQREIAERGVSAVTRTVRFTVPQGAQPGVPLTVTVTAADPGLQLGVRSARTLIMVTERPLRAAQP